MSRLPEEEQFDAMLGDFLHESLDPQRGRGERYFRERLNDAIRNSWKQRTWLVGAFITGMAASVMMLWASPMFHSAGPPGGSIVTTPVYQSRENPVSAGQLIPAVERVVQSQTSDEGVIVLDGNTPVRVVRRQQQEQARWIDGQQNLRVRQEPARDELVFIKMPTY